MRICPRCPTVPRPRRYFRWTDEAKAYLADLLSGPPCTDQFLCDALSHRFDRPLTVGGLREMMLRSGYRKPNVPPPKPRVPCHWSPQVVGRAVELYDGNRRSATAVARILRREFSHPYTKSMVIGKMHRMGYRPGRNAAPRRPPGPLVAKRDLFERQQNALARRSGRCDAGGATENPNQ